MPRITFLPSGKTGDAPYGAGVCDAARELGLALETPCGGKGTCGKCRVKVVSGCVEADSEGMLTRREIDEGYVLACRARITHDAVTIEIPEPRAREDAGGAIDEAACIDDALLPGEFRIDPHAVKSCVHVSAPAREDGLSDEDRLRKSLHDRFGAEEIACTLPVLRALPLITVRQ